MAANVDSVAVAKLIKQHWETPFVETLDRDVTLFQFFPRKAMEGKSAQWKSHVPNSGDTLSDGSTVVSKGVSYIENAALTATNKQKDIEHEIFVKQVYVGVEVSGLAQAATEGSVAFMQALSRETKEAIEDLKDAINDMLMANTATNNAAQTTGAANSNADIDGFRGIIVKGNSASNFYAGNALDTYTHLKPYCISNSGTPRALTMALMQNITAQMELPARMGARISDILCARVHFNQYGNLLSDYRRYVDSSTMDGGVTKLAFENTAVTSIPALPAGGMYFVDKRDWNYYVLTNFETIPQSVTHDGDRFVIIHRAQLVCKNTGRQAAILDLITS